VPADLAAATRFVDTNARLVERRRLAHLFEGGPAAAVVDAVRAYRNPDGGFGALEPDLRDPASQPAAVSLALEMLAEAGAFDDPMADAACDWLATISTPEGAVPFVLPSAAGHPHAPWLAPDAEPSVILTGMLAGHLHSQGSGHGWLGPASEWLWARAEEGRFEGAYQTRAIVHFLDSVADAARAEAALAGVAPAVAAIVELDPDAPGEVHGPLEFAPLPGTRSRSLFDQATIDAHLDALERRQGDDGGWPFNWPAWAPGPELEWRGVMTVHALKTLHANGRPAA
jgi:hypothetical protein